MAGYFFDSSATVKRYVQETGTSWVINLFRTSNQDSFYCARITLVEVISAFSRRLKSKSLSSNQTTRAKTRFRCIFHRKFFKIEIDGVLIVKAADLAEKYALRGYDAVQLAAAITSNNARISIGASGLIFVSADKELNNAATVEGLTVENPNDYP
jgi:predicted nucleic acid-binding protein